MGWCLKVRTCDGGGGAPIPVAAAAPGRPQDRRSPAPGRHRARESLRRSRTGRRRQRTGHFSSAHRNDVPAMLSGGGGQPHLWDIVAAVTTSMGHRCGCPARLSSIDVPSLRLRPGLAARGWRPGARCARSRGDLNGGHREPGAEEPGTGSPGSALPSVSKWNPALAYQCYLPGRPAGGPATDAGTSLR